uniref:Natural killer cell receptor 2B4 immunoglobulin domain-containing protein n=1 Tax=Dicentrarchus labrax TaxID=13489 RepID=A0A8P4KFH0_DICLA
MMLISVLSAGTSTGTPVFVQTGKDLFLEVNKPVTPLLQVKGSDFKWTLNDKINIVKLANGNAIILNFEDRAEFYKENYTLVLKNVQKKDSGEYIAKVSGKQEHLVAEYKVTVMDPVSPVKLEVNPSSSCNLTVICSTTDSHISSTYRCVNQTCSPEGRERSEVTTYPSIEVYLQQGLIICNHSNQVSWEQDTLEIKPLCEKQTGTGKIKRHHNKHFSHDVFLVNIFDTASQSHCLSALNSRAYIVWGKCCNCHMQIIINRYVTKYQKHTLVTKKRLNSDREIISTSRTVLPF